MDGLCRRRAPVGVGLLVLALSVVLIGTAPALAQQRGGRMVVSYLSDVTTLDPAIGYDWQNWSIIKSIFDGLMDYVPGTTNLRTHLAESYAISPDGLTYTFRLRPGVRFHNGRELVAADVKYSIERVLDPATQSPGQGFFTDIVGADERIAGQAGEVPGIRVIDDRTVEFVLKQPNAAFLHILGLNFAHVVPREEVERYGADFGHNPVGTGAFKMREWVLGQRLVLQRNPDYFLPDRPFLDELIFEVGIDPLVAYLRLQRGEVDVLGDGIPAARFVQVMNDANLRPLVAVGDQLHTGYVAINTQVEPFDDVRVRRALNMAINKERIVQIINNRAEPANQPLPPLMPGYGSSYAGFSYDPQAARALLAEAGYPNGFRTVLYANNTDPNPRIAQAIQQDLSTVGVQVELRVLAQGPVIEAAGTPEAAPLVWSGGMAWIADYPDPGNFYWPILSCRSATPGGWNWAWYCNPELDRMAAEADAITAPERQDERIEIYRQVFTQIAEDGAWIPVFNERRFTMHSDRVGGDELLFVDPIHIPVNYDEVYVR
ncbi:ABC transporter substrate-binding protein [Limnochorda pilosa]|uniref:ABC transporter substrate-binding protein n=1 Tax=Limnochorda pilosa TaxID=1555112 RepID=UPI000ADDE81A